MSIIRRLLRAQDSVATNAPAALHFAMNRTLKHKDVRSSAEDAAALPAQQPPTFGKCVVFLHLLKHTPVALIAEFCGSCRYGHYGPCSLCGEGRAVPVRGGHDTWEFWCSKCATGFLQDGTSPNIHAHSNSLDANSDYSRTTTRCGF